MIAARSFPGKTVAVFGLARTGLASVRALKAGGANVIAWDDNSAARDAGVGAGAEIAPWREWNWDGIAALILSPGVPLTHPKPHEIVTHAKLQFPRGEAAKHYNGLQRLSYFIVLFVLGPLIVLTGLTMSPTMDSVLPLAWLFGGRQSARTIHFIVAFSFVGFFIIHMLALFLSAPINGLRSMITGWFAIQKEPRDG